jgi:hypothetical protein
MPTPSFEECKHTHKKKKSPLINFAISCKKTKNLLRIHCKVLKHAMFTMWKYLVSCALNLSAYYTVSFEAYKSIDVNLHV